MTASNHGIDYNSDLISNVRLNEPEVNHNVQRIIHRANTDITGLNEIGWLLRAVTCIDLTTLGGDDTPSNVSALCKKAAKPVDLPFEWPEKLTTAAICVYPSRVEDAVRALKDLEVSENVNVASVATGFPSGQYPLNSRLEEIKYAIEMGANEIDVVINRTLALTHKWEELYSELTKMKEACGTAHMKTILATGELCDLKHVYIASMVAMMAGSDFIKTSTGKESVNATLPVGFVMCRAIRDYYGSTGVQVGFKPAGGIRTAKEALQWLTLIEQELGHEWLNNKLFRFGASGLLGDISSRIKTLLAPLSRD